MDTIWATADQGLGCSVGQGVALSYMGATKKIGVP